MHSNVTIKKKLVMWKWRACLCGADDVHGDDAGNSTTEATTNARLSLYSAFRSLQPVYRSAFHSFTLIFCSFPHKKTCCEYWRESIYISVAALQLWEVKRNCWTHTLMLSTTLTTTSKLPLSSVDIGAVTRGKLLITVLCCNRLQHNHTHMNSSGKIVYFGLGFLYVFCRFSY